MNRNGCRHPELPSTLGSRISAIPCTEPLLVGNASSTNSPLSLPGASPCCHIVIVQPGQGRLVLDGREHRDRAHTLELARGRDTRTSSRRIDRKLVVTSAEPPSHVMSSKLLPIPEIPTGL